MKKEEEKFDDIKVKLTKEDAKALAKAGKKAEKELGIVEGKKMK